MQLEDALKQAGIEPTVLSTVAQVERADPLHHIGCCSLKVYGDYQDPLIRNAPEELAQYPDAINRLRDRMFDATAVPIVSS